jgi:uncharacterized phage-associated protein
MPLEFRPKFDKIVELLLYLAHKRPGLDKYQIVKLFYLADREHLARHGRPITYERYCALKYGPVASNTMDLLENDKHTFRKANIDVLPFRTEVLRNEKGTPITYIREPYREVDTTLFSKSDLRVMDEILEEYGHLNFDELYNLTHSHEAYKKAWEGRRAFYAKSADMYYEEMVEDERRREAILEDIGPVASRMR